MTKKIKVLFYDIETSPLQAWVWGQGQQYVSHSQFVENYKMWDLISIQYCWNDGKKAKVLRYDKHGGTKGMIEAFDEIVKKADITIGKNSNKFDSKMINSLRMLHKIKGFPEWTLIKDDLEVQMRRHFRLPSQSLDYISDLLGYGGKIKMEMRDWIDIANYRQLMRFESNHKEVSKVLFSKSCREVLRDGKKALNKMCEYGAKDVVDTRELWNYLSEHFMPSYNMATHVGERLACKQLGCGSTNIIKNGTRLSAGQTMYQKFQCNDCGKYAGKAAILANGKYGKIC